MIKLIQLYTDASIRSRRVGLGLCIWGSDVEERFALPGGADRGVAYAESAAVEHAVKWVLNNYAPNTEYKILTDACSFLNYFNDKVKRPKDLLKRSIERIKADLQILLEDGVSVEISGCKGHSVIKREYDWRKNVGIALNCEAHRLAKKATHIPPNNILSDGFLNIIGDKSNDRLSKHIRDSNDKFFDFLRLVIDGRHFDGWFKCGACNCHYRGSPLRS